MIGVSAAALTAAAAAEGSALPPVPQSTSTNANNSLFLSRVTNLPTGAFFIQFRVRCTDWGAGNNNQNLLYANFVGGPEAQIYVNRGSGTIRFWYGDDAVAASGSPTGWGTCRISSNGVTITIGYTPDGGVETTVSLGHAQLLGVYFLGISFYPTNLPNQVHGCTALVLSRAATEPERLAQIVSDTPIPEFAGAVNGFYSMADAATANIEESGTGFNLTLAGAGTTVEDSPY